jgi:hypothetical protein
MLRPMTPREVLCHILAAAFALLVVTPPIVMLLDRRDPAELTGGQMLPHDVRSGQAVTIAWDIIERRACAGEFTPIIIDAGKQVHYFARQPTVYRDTLRPDGLRFYKHITLPTGLAPGPAIYTVQVERWCNPLQRYLWPIPSKAARIEFNVIE